MKKLLSVLLSISFCLITIFSFTSCGVAKSQLKGKWITQDILSVAADSSSDKLFRFSYRNTNSTFLPQTSGWTSIEFIEGNSFVINHNQYNYSYKGTYSITGDVLECSLGYSVLFCGKSEISNDKIIIHNGNNVVTLYKCATFDSKPTFAITNDNVSNYKTPSDTAGYPESSREVSFEISDIKQDDNGKNIIEVKEHIKITYVEDYGRSPTTKTDTYYFVWIPSANDWWCERIQYDRYYY